MKKFSIMFMLLISLLTFGQVKDSIKEPSASQEVERLIDKYGGKVIDGFNHVVEKTTPIAKEGFYIAVKLNIAEGISMLLPLLFFFIFGYVFMNEYNRINNLLNSDKVPLNMDNRYGPFDDNNATPLLITLIVFTFILFIMTLICTSSGIKHLIAPEWYAIEDIINLVKPS